MLSFGWLSFQTRHECHHSSKLPNFLTRYNSFLLGVFIAHFVTWYFQYLIRNHSQRCEYTCEAKISGVYRHGKHMHGDLTNNKIARQRQLVTGLHSIDFPVIYRVSTEHWCLKVDEVLASIVLLLDLKLWWKYFLFVCTNNFIASGIFLFSDLIIWASKLVMAKVHTLFQICWQFNRCYVPGSF